MKKPEENSPQARSDRKSPWERPTVRLAGTIALLVRTGSAGGKQFGDNDGDASQFQSCAPNKPPGQGGCP